jgi:hypothetical protein
MLIKFFKKMKKVLFFALFLTFLGAANVNGQVTIGKNEAPHPASVLDLRSTDKGLLLPRVDISDANTFQLSTGREDEAIGLTVYNTNKAMLNGQGAGIYAWSGSKWMIVSADGGGTAIPVMIITVSSPNSSVVSGDKEQFSVDVQPGNATNPNYTWSIVSGGGTSSITPEGLFTAGSPGDLTVRATATDGSGIYGEKRITVNSPAVPVKAIWVSEWPLSGTEARKWHHYVTPENATNKKVIWSVVSETLRGILTVDQTGLITATNIGSGTAVIRVTSSSDPSIFGEATIKVFAKEIGPTGQGTVTGTNGTYATYCYPGIVGCWMIENSKEGTPTFTAYPGKLEGERGYYYGWDNCETACPDGWRLPLVHDHEALSEYVSTHPEFAATRGAWRELGAGARGDWPGTTYPWSSWDRESWYWGRGSWNYDGRGTWGFGQAIGYDSRVAASVRCLKAR